MTKKGTKKIAVILSLVMLMTCAMGTSVFAGHKHSNVGPYNGVLYCSGCHQVTLSVPQTAQVKMTYGKTTKTVSLSKKKASAKITGVAKNGTKVKMQSRYQTYNKKSKKYVWGSWSKASTVKY